MLKADWQEVFVGRLLEALQATIALAVEHSGNGHAITADLTQETDVKALFAQIRERFGRLELLLNNAGISLPFTLPGEMLGDDWRRAMDINLNGAIYALS